VHAELVYGHGITIGHNTVSLLMRRTGLAGLPAPSRGKRSRKLATVTDLVRRDFRRASPNQLCVTDITEHPTREGKVYCCVVLDAWSRRVVGWAIDSRQRADLATNALGMAIDSRDPAAGGIIHGDHGTQLEFKGSSQHRLVGRSIGTRRGPLRGSSRRGSCGGGH
jgi:putative transposase